MASRQQCFWDDKTGFAARQALNGDHESWSLDCPSRGDAQLLLDVSHHRVLQARLAEFREVLDDGALPWFSILLRDGLAFVGKVERLRFRFVLSYKHECVRPVG